MGRNCNVIISVHTDTKEQVLGLKFIHDQLVFVLLFQASHFTPLYNLLFSLMKPRFW